MGAYFFPPAPGVVRIYFVWEVRPYWAAFGLSHTNCMGFSAIRFVWPNICIFPKVDRGWQNYFDTVYIVLVVWAKICSWLAIVD
jgi:hypothetical protein